MRYLALILIILGLLIPIFVFWPVIREETKYNFEKISKVKYVLSDEQLNTFEKPLVPPNKDFSIIIPKIGAVAPVISNVDPADSKKYLAALRKGVAHAAGTSFPSEDEGNVFLFAHSTDTFYNVNTYNAVFYLIGKLKTGDEIDVYFRGRLHKYIVYDKKVVEPDASEYFGPQIAGEKTLTLQTCYPPGTTLKRLVVLAKEATN